MEIVKAVRHHREWLVPGALKGSGTVDINRTAACLVPRTRLEAPDEMG